MSVRVEAKLDWDSFIHHAWDREPVLFTSVDPAPFVPAEVFCAAVLGTVPRHPLSLPPNVQFTIERDQQTQPGDHLPRRSDVSFDGYCDRLAEQLGGRRHALVVHGLHAFWYPQWRRERSFFAELWRRVGQPITGGITTLFHGNYEHSPVGVHRDRFATVMFVLRGHKRMRLWTRRPWSAPVTTVLDYQAYLADSSCVDVGPGQLLYWPASYYHVGESLGPQPATSVNVGIPREEHDVTYDLDTLLLGVDRGTLPDAGLEALPAVQAGLFVPDGALPTALGQALNVLRDRVDGARLDDLLDEVSLRQATDGGFRPVPPPAATAPLPDTVRLTVRGDIRLARCSDGWMCAANGHTSRTTVDAPRLLRSCSTGHPVTVGDLLASLADPEGSVPVRTARAGRDLLRSLESYRALVRVDR